MTKQSHSQVFTQVKKKKYKQNKTCTSMFTEASLTHTHQIRVTSQISLNWEINEQTVVHPYYGTE